MGARGVTKGRLGNNLLNICTFNQSLIDCKHSNKGKPINKISLANVHIIIKKLEEREAIYDS